MVIIFNILQPLLFWLSVVCIFIFNINSLIWSGNETLHFMFILQWVIRREELKCGKDFHIVLLVWNILLKSALVDILCAFGEEEILSFLSLDRFYQNKKEKEKCIAWFSISWVITHHPNCMLYPLCKQQLIKRKRNSKSNRLILDW